MEQRENTWVKPSIVPIADEAADDDDVGMRNGGSIG
jgi:hypothetical protein